MPEQPSSSSPPVLSAHYVVEGEGVRDNEWAEASAAPITFSVVGQQHFKLLLVPPSPQHSIVPTVRIFDSAARPQYILRQATKSAAVNMQRALSSEAVVSDSRPADALVDQHLANRVSAFSPPAPSSVTPTTPRRHVFSSSRMIARPVSHPTRIASPPPTPAPAADASDAPEASTSSLARRETVASASTGKEPHESDDAELRPKALPSLSLNKDLHHPGRKHEVSTPSAEDPPHKEATPNQEQPMEPSLRQSARPSVQVVAEKPTHKSTPSTPSPVLQQVTEKPGLSTGEASERKQALPSSPPINRTAIGKTVGSSKKGRLQNISVVTQREAMENLLQGRKASERKKNFRSMPPLPCRTALGVTQDPNPSHADVVRKPSALVHPPAQGPVPVRHGDATMKEGAISRFPYATPHKKPVSVDVNSCGVSYSGTDARKETNLSSSGAQASNSVERMKPDGLPKSVERSKPDPTPKAIAEVNVEVQLAAPGTVIGQDSARAPESSRNHVDSTKQEVSGTAQRHQVTKDIVKGPVEAVTASHEVGNGMPEETVAVVGQSGIAPASRVQARGKSIASKADCDSGHFAKASAIKGSPSERDPGQVLQIRSAEKKPSVTMGPEALGAREPRGGHKSEYRKHLVQEPFERCTVLMIKALCKVNRRPIAKRAASKCWREVFLICKPPVSCRSEKPSSRHKVEPDNGASRGTESSQEVIEHAKVEAEETNNAASGSERFLQTGNRYDAAASKFMPPLPRGSFRPAKKLDTSTSHAAQGSSSSPSPRSTGDAVKAVSRDKSEAPGRLKAVVKSPTARHTGQLGATPNSLQLLTSKEIRGISFMLIQWKGAIESGKGRIADIAAGAKRISGICDALESKAPGMVPLSEDDVVNQVEELNKAGSTLLFLWKESDTSTGTRESGSSRQLLDPKPALLALEGVMKWVDYLADRLLELWREKNNTYHNDSPVHCAFHSRMRAFLGEARRPDSVSFALRTLKKGLPERKATDDGKPYFAMRKKIGETAAKTISVLKIVGKSSFGPSGESAVQTGPNASEDGGAGLKRDTVNRNTSEETIQKSPDERVQDVDSQTSAPLLVTPVSLDDTASGALPTVPRLRSPKGISGDHSKQSSSGGGRMVAGLQKTSAKAGFDNAAVVKKILSEAVSPDKRARDEGRRSPVIRGSAAVDSESEDMKPPGGILRKAPDADNVDKENGMGPATKKRKAKVSFVPNFVRGEYKSTIDADNLPSLFHDGYDLLGTGNVIQEAAVKERSDELSRGAVFALFGYLRSEVSGWKRQAEGNSAPVPETVEIPYTNSAMKQVQRLLKTDVQPSKNPDK